MSALRARVQNGPHYRWWALGVLLIGFFSVGVSITILTAVLPTIARQFGVGTATIAWVVTGPMLVVGVLNPTMGKAGDLYGRKRVYLVGWAASMVLAGLAAVSWSAGSLIAFRLLGAAAGAATGPAALAIILGSFPAEERVTAMGWWSFMGAGAPVIGLVAGGPLVDLVGWRWIFGVQPVLALPGMALAWFLLKEERPHEHPVFDTWGSVTLGLCVAALLYGLNRAGTSGWTRPQVLVPLALAPLLGAAFFAVEAKHSSPLLPLLYLRRRNVTVPTAVQLVSNFPYMGCFFISPFLLHQVLRYDDARTAFALLPRPLANSVLSFAAAYVAVRTGERFTAVAGMAVMAGGMVSLAAVGPGSGVGLVVLGMALTGAGLGLSYPGLASSVANAVRESDFGSMAAVQNLAQTVGMVAGMQGLQTFQAIRARAVGTVAGYHDAFWLGAVISVVALVMSLGVRSMHRPLTGPPSESPRAPYVPVAQASGGSDGSASPRHVRRYASAIAHAPA